MIFISPNFMPKLPRVNQKGVTMVELIIAIVITGILAGIIAVFIVRPMQGYVDLGRRAALVDSAESALRRMARDIRIALPDSVRVNQAGGPGFVLELLPILEGGMYRDGGGNEGGVAANNPSRLTGFGGGGDNEFDIHDVFRSSNIVVPSTNNPHRLVINNIGSNTIGYNAYNPTLGPRGSVITPSNVTINYAASNITNATRIQLRVGANPAPNHPFPQRSSGQRVYVITTPVTYLCDPAVGTLMRYDNYAIQSTQPTTAAVLSGLANVRVGLVADHVSTCSAAYGTGTIQSRGLVSLDLTIEDQGEKIRLLHQVQVDNSP